MATHQQDQKKTAEEEGEDPQVEEHGEEEDPHQVDDRQEEVDLGAVEEHDEGRSVQIQKDHQRGRAMEDHCEDWPPKEAPEAGTAEAEWRRVQPPTGLQS
jgi:hypothetical protein